MGWGYGGLAHQLEDESHVCNKIENAFSTFETSYHLGNGVSSICNTDLLLCIVVACQTCTVNGLVSVISVIDPPSTVCVKAIIFTQCMQMIVDFMLTESIFQVILGRGLFCET